MAQTVTAAREIVVDDRGRTSLAKVRTRREFTRYLVTEHPDGTLVLTPAITISPAELEKLRGKTA